MTRLQELLELTSGLPDNVKRIINPLLKDIVYEEQMLEKFRSNPKTKTNLAMNKAFRQIKQLYQSDLKLLLWQLKQNEAGEADSLLAKLAEFE